MKIIVVIGLVLFSIPLLSQNAVKFSHDAGGNMTQRYTRNMNLRVGQASADSLLGFKVYPNPTKEYVTIEGTLQGMDPALVSIYDINGALLQQDRYEGSKKTFQLQGYANGIYFLELKYSDSKSANYRLVIAE